MKTNSFVQWDIRFQFISVYFQLLQDARDLLEKFGIADTRQSIEDSQHPRLWYVYCIFNEETLY